MKVAVMRKIAPAKAISPKIERRRLATAAAFIVKHEERLVAAVVDLGNVNRSADDKAKLILA
ncbi:MAG: hypothetical protein HC857_16790 [Synechococcales cyanobacterium RU_4_20]|nr:hypothetical protein [Synechococcales cyanobacterium RU_4_20]